MNNYFQQQIEALREGRALNMSDREILQWVIGLADSAIQESGGQGLHPDEFDALIQGSVKTLPAPPLPTPAQNPPGFIALEDDRQTIGIDPAFIASGIRSAIETIIRTAQTIQVVNAPAYTLTPAQLMDSALERTFRPVAYKLAMFAISDGAGFKHDTALVDARLVNRDLYQLTPEGEATLGTYAFTLVQTLEWLYESFDQKGWAAIESERDINPLRIAKLGTPEYETIVCAMGGGGLASEEPDTGCLSAEINGWLYRAQTGQNVSYVITPAGLRRVGELVIKMRASIEMLSEKLS